MFNQFIESDNVYISMISGYNLYLETGEFSETVSHNHAIHVTHINSEEDYYLVKLNKSRNSVSLNDFINIILRPANKSFFGL